MRIITEEDAVSLKGFVIACCEKLHNKSQAEKIAKREAPKWRGTPLLCEYDEHSHSGRSVKRYLPLVQYESP